MTEPDEALLWARERALKYTNPALHNEIREGLLDHDFGITELATGYRAGAAASEARIKALKARVAELERRTPVDGLRCEIVEDGKTMKITIPGGTFLAPLKEADQ